MGRAEQLTAANALSTILEGAGVLVGPLLCGVLIAVASPAAVYVVAGLATLSAAVLVGLLWSRSRAAARPAPAPVPGAGPRPRSQQPAHAGPVAPAPTPSIGDGLRAVRRAPSRLLAIGLLATRFGVAAGLDVLLVLAAIEQLGMGDAGAGYLSAAIGLGWVLGGATTLVIVGRPRLTPLMVVGAIIWAIPVLVVATVVSPAPALGLALVVAGIGLAVVDVAVRTVLQRLVAERRTGRRLRDRRGRIDGRRRDRRADRRDPGRTRRPHGGHRRRRLLLPLVALSVLVTVGRAEAAVHIPFREIAILRRLTLFAPAPAPALESAAAALVRVDLPAGSSSSARAPSATASGSSIPAR